MKKSVLLLFTMSVVILGGCFKKEEIAVAPTKNEEIQNIQQTGNKTQKTGDTDSGENLNQTGTSIKTDISTGKNDTTKDARIQYASLNDLLKLKKDIRCEIAESSGNILKGTKIYIDGQNSKIRTDITTEGKDLSGNVEKSTISILGDKKYRYVWGDMFKDRGMKSLQEKNDSEMDKKVALKCRKRDKDDTKFQLPKGVTFFKQ